MEKIEKGFYYHYKHDPTIAINNFAYEVINTAFNTESKLTHHEDLEGFLKDEVVIYRALYDNSIAYKNGKKFWIRPIGMFEEMVTKEGKTFPRFQKITDSKIIEELIKVRDEMYK